MDWCLAVRYENKLLVRVRFVLTSLCIYLNVRYGCVWTECFDVVIWSFGHVSVCVQSFLAAMFLFYACVRFFFLILAWTSNILNTSIMLCPSSSTQIFDDCSYLIIICGSAVQMVHKVHHFWHSSGAHSVFRPRVLKYSCNLPKNWAREDLYFSRSPACGFY